MGRRSRDVADITSGLQFSYSASKSVDRLMGLGFGFSDFNVNRLVVLQPPRNPLARVRHLRNNPQPAMFF